MVNLGPAVLNESFVRDVVVVTQLLSFKLQPEKKFCLLREPKNKRKENQRNGYLSSEMVLN